IALVLGFRELRRSIGRGQRTSAEPLPPPPLPLPFGGGGTAFVGRSSSSSNPHVVAQRDNLTTPAGKKQPQQQQCAARIVAHTGRVSSVAISPDGKWVLTGSADRAVRLFDLATGYEVRQLIRFEGGVRGVAFSPDGQLAAACGHHSSE